jgi:hypothetical protein
MDNAPRQGQAIINLFGGLKMKKMFRLLCAALAALCVFAACGDGGDDSSYTPSSSVYSGFTASGDLLVLTITEDSGKALVTSGSYTLEINGVQKSSGKVSESGGTMTFTSAAGKTFTASVTGSAPPVFSDPIPLDDNTTIAAPVLSGGDSDTAAILIAGVQVYNPDGTPYAGADVNLINGYIDDDSSATTAPGSYSLGRVGKINGGKLFLNLQDVPNDKLYLKEDNSYRGNIRFQDVSSPIGLSLVKFGEKEEIVLSYFSKDVHIEDDVEGDFYIKKGWSFLILKRWEDGDGVRHTSHAIYSLEELYDKDYKWIYKPDPLEGGPWIGVYGDGDGRESISYTFSGSVYTRVITPVEGSPTTTSGTFAFAGAGDEIEFTQTSPSSSTWKQGVIFCGNAISMESRHADWEGYGITFYLDP